MSNYDIVMEEPALRALALLKKGRDPEYADLKSLAMFLYYEMVLNCEVSPDAEELDEIDRNIYAGLFWQKIIENDKPLLTVVKS